PADTLALVGNKSAVGEQYVDLEPRTDQGPYLKDGSEIATASTQV
ncbi:mammalian cell entry protein, partial [Nocardioides pocheonensis]